MLDSTTTAQIRVATFSIDITIPLGHRCMGVLPTKSARIDDPLELLGLVILGPDDPVVLVALDWCEVRNGAYDQWRESMAARVGTAREPIVVGSLHQHDAPVADRRAQKSLDAVGLSSLERLDRRQPIDLPCLDLGVAQVVLLPGEAFVGYQLLAQQFRPDSFVMTIGYGECWPGYRPTKAAFDEGFGHGWRWVGRGCEAIIREKLKRVLTKSSTAEEAKQSDAKH